MGEAGDYFSIPFEELREAEAEKLIQAQRRKREYREHSLQRKKELEQERALKENQGFSITNKISQEIGFVLDQLVDAKPDIAIYHRVKHRGWRGDKYYFEPGWDLVRVKTRSDYWENENLYESYHTKHGLALYPDGNLCVTTRTEGAISTEYGPLPLHKLIKIVRLPYDLTGEWSGQGFRGIDVSCYEDTIRKNNEVSFEQLRQGLANLSVRATMQ